MITQIKILQLGWENVYIITRNKTATMMMTIA